MKVIKIEKSKIKSDIGSLATDNNYFINYYAKKYGENSFLYVEINDNFQFKVVLGDAIRHSLFEIDYELLIELLEDSKRILKEKKIQWMKAIKENPEWE